MISSCFAAINSASVVFPLPGAPIIKNSFLGAPSKELNLNPAIYTHLESILKNDYKKHQRRHDIFYNKN